jgi:hypothetical protein
LYISVIDLQALLYVLEDLSTVMLADHYSGSSQDERKKSAFFNYPTYVCGIGITKKSFKVYMWHFNVKLI